MGIGIRDRVVEKLISLMKENSSITKFTGSDTDARIYGSHPATIQDAALPAVSITMINGSGREFEKGFLDVLFLQIEPWMKGVGADANVKDDLYECHSGIIEVLHRVKGWDDTIGIKILEVTQIAKIGLITDPDGIIHLPTRWRIKATT